LTLVKYRWWDIRKSSLHKTSKNPLSDDHWCTHKWCFLSTIKIKLSFVNSTKSSIGPKLKYEMKFCYFISFFSYLCWIKIHPSPSGQSFVHPTRINISPSDVVTPTFSEKQKTLFKLNGHATFNGWWPSSSVRINHNVPSPLIYLQKTTTSFF